MIDIIFVSPVLEFPPAGGPQLKINNTIKVLSEITNLHLFNRDRSLTSKEYKISSDYYINKAYKYFDLINLPNGKKKRRMKKLFIKLSLICMNIFAISHALKIVNYAKKNKIKLFWIGYGNLSFGLIFYLKILYPKSRIVYDTDSVWSRYIKREIPYAKKIRKIILFLRGNLKSLEEIFLTKYCDITTAVSDTDADYYKKFVHDKTKVKVLSNVIDLDSYKKKYIKSKIKNENPSIYLAGSFGHENSPMDQAALWMMREILPLVWEKISNAQFYLVGRNSENCFKEYSKNKNIITTGKVESVLPYLMYSDLSVVPLKFESGTRFKILESGACNIPVVSTTLGAEGLNVTNNKDILIADDPQDFANNIINLISNKEKAIFIANNCRRIIEKKYCLNTLRKQAKNIIESL